MDKLAGLLSLLFQLHGPCYASVFGYEGDAMKGGQAVCVHRDLRPGEEGVASRDFPCGTRLLVENVRTGLRRVLRVVDKGPYGAVADGRWVLKRAQSDPGEWRGCLDLTLAASAGLGHNGFERIMYVPYAEYVKARAAWDRVLRWARSIALKEAANRRS